MPHRFSWNQLLIIVPDRVVHPQPQHWATGAETHWSSTENSQNCVAKTQRVFFLSPVILYTHDGIQKWICEVHIWYSGIHLHGWICVTFPLTCSPGLEGSGDAIDNQLKKWCREDGKRKKEKLKYILAMLSRMSGNGFWEEKAPVYMSNGLCICVREEDYV